MGVKRDALYDALMEAASGGDLTVEVLVCHITGWISEADADAFGAYLEGAEIIHWSDEDDDDDGDEDCDEDCDEDDGDDAA